MTQLSLPLDEVHVWYWPPPVVLDEATESRGVAMLAPDERDRLARYRHEGARVLYFAGAVLARMTLSQYAAVPCDQWQFAANAHGKPRVTAPPAGVPLRFNLTHTDGLAACAIAWDRDVGVDAEAAGRAVEPELARRFFAPSEAAHLDRLPEPERADMFLRYWTAKEAYLKARGTGLATALNSFAIDLSADRPRVRGAAADPAADAGWQFFQFRPTPAHWLAVSVAALPGEHLHLVARAATSEIERLLRSGI